MFRTKSDNDPNILRQNESAAKRKAGVHADQGKQATIIAKVRDEYFGRPFTVLVSDNAGRKNCGGGPIPEYAPEHADPNRPMRAVKVFRRR